MSLLPFTRWSVTAPPAFLTDALGDRPDLTPNPQRLRAMAIALIVRGELTEAAGIGGRPLAASRAPTGKVRRMLREAVGIGSRQGGTALGPRVHLETGRNS